MAATDPVFALLDLVLPRVCGGCGAAGCALCGRCRRQLDAGPVRLAPRVAPGVPCWALGDYTEARRAVVLAIKERGRRDLCRPVGAALAGAIGRLRISGDLDEDLVSSLLIVPAPGRAVAARRRGGDPVLAICRMLADELDRPPRHRVGRGGPRGDRVGRGGPRAQVAPILSLDRSVRDSVGLTAAQRRANLAGHLRIRPGSAARAIARMSDRSPGVAPPVVLIDDVLTTGATAAESVALLGNSGLSVTAVIVVASGAREHSGHGRSIPTTRW